MVGKKKMNTNEEFLKLNNDDSYYRFDLYEVYNNDLINCGWRSIDTIYGLACITIASYLDSAYGIKAIWGKGCAEYDKGTRFENNNDYYLFYKVSSEEQGRDIEEDVIDNFCRFFPYKENGIV